MSIKKGSVIENIKIERLGYKGIGICTILSGKKLLLKGNNIPESIVNCKITKRKKDYLEGKVTKIVSLPQGSFFEEPKCPHYISPMKEECGTKSGCGGCTRQMVKYKKQLERKQSIVQDSFRSKLLQDIIVNPIMPTKSKYSYRNKIEFSFGKFIQGYKKRKNNKIDKNSKKIKVDEDDKKNKNSEKNNGINKPFGTTKIYENRNLGFHKKGEFSKIIDVEQCFLVSAKAHKIFKHMKNILKDSGLPVYDQKTHEGFFRHLVIREGFHTDQFLINLGVSLNNIQNNEKQIEQRNILKQTIESDSLLKKWITTFCITDNNGLADIVRGQDANLEILRGEGCVYEKLTFPGGKKKTVKNENKFVIEGGKMKEIESTKNIPNTNENLSGIVEVNFRISPFSFFQTNTVGAEKLFNEAMKLIGNVDGTILDLYCGGGSIGLSLLKQGLGSRLVGIDIVESSIKDAKENAKINHCKDNSYFISGKAENIVRNEDFCEKKIKDLGLIIVDPPRDGLHKYVRKFLIDLHKRFNCKLLYISCNPVSFARDCEELMIGGWNIETVQPVDMFPQTFHIELINILE